MQKINIIGTASGLGAEDQGTGDGPVALRASTLCEQYLASHKSWYWETLLSPAAGDDNNLILKDLFYNLGTEVKHSVAAGEAFVVLGGDHSVAIGTWSGVACERRQQGDVGLLWLDAHLDGHTPETSPSQNLHGMPVACLLGHGSPLYTALFDHNAKIKPEHLCIIGARSYEAGERALLEGLGVRVFYMDEVLERGMSGIYEEALAIVQSAPGGFGISVDVDAIEPQDAPAVGTPVVNGITGLAVLDFLQRFRDCSALLGLEITEFNPHRDVDEITMKLVFDMIAAIY